MIPKRRRRAKMGTRISDIVRSPGHLQWVRGHECVTTMHLCNFGTRCEGQIEAHHLYAPGDAKGRKPPDSRTVPICSRHHEECGRAFGRDEFEYRYQVDLMYVAAELWRRSPHRIAWERKQKERQRVLEMEKTS